jgi:hypothetical protein
MPRNAKAAGANRGLAGIQQAEPALNVPLTEIVQASDRERELQALVESKLQELGNFLAALADVCESPLGSTAAAETPHGRVSAHLLRRWP